MPLFITLTYPGRFPTARDSKRHLAAFRKRLLRQYPHCSGIWRLELQDRGAPHYHLLVFGVQFIPWKWTANAWYGVVKHRKKEHLDAGTETRRVRSWRGVMSYASKYLAKENGEIVDQETGEIVEPDYGRSWGVFGKENLPIEIHDEILSAADWNAAVRVVEGYYRSVRRAKKHRKRRHRGRGISVFLDSGGEALLRWSKSR